MYAVAMMFVLGLVLLVTQGLAQQFSDLASMYRAQSRSLFTTAMATRIEQHWQRAGSLPASIAALGATDGFEDTRSLVEPAQGYVVSATITDARWQFVRAVLYSKSTDQAAADYLAANVCGAGSAEVSTTTSWCGAKTSLWFRRETRSDYTDQINTQRARLNRTLQKLATAYNVANNFPSLDATGAGLAAGSIYSLAALAGYAGTAAACTGPFTLTGGTPLDCSDLFDGWGQAVGYQFNTSKYIVLVSESPIVNAGGTAVVIASELDASSF